MRRYSLVSIFLLGFLFVFAPAASATTYTVTKTTDTVDGICDADCSLREAIIAANANSGSDTISIPAGTYTTTVSGTEANNATIGDLDFTDTSGTLTITGAGSDSTIIDGGVSIDRVFELRANTTVAMSGVTIQGGEKTNDYGAGINVQNSANLTLTDSVVTGNTATLSGFGSAYGAGISCSSSTLTLDNVTISSNAASGGGNGGGGLAIQNCQADINDTTITNNSSNYNGGGLYIDVDSVNTVTITDTTISNNTTGSYGGGIVLYGTDGDNRLTLNRVLFDGNSAGLDSGGIQLESGAYMTNTIFVDNTADRNGGAMFVYQQTDVDVTLAHATVVRNFADADDNGVGVGGGIYIDQQNADFAVKASVVVENYEGDPNADGSTWTGKDCDEAGIGPTVAVTYSLFGNSVPDTSDCTLDTNSNNIENPGSTSTFFVKTLEDLGGNIQTLYHTNGDITDAVSEAECDDALGNPLMVDARGLTRPENSNCDRGAFELDQTDPVVAITSGTDTVQCVTGSWTNAGATAIDNYATGLTTAVTSGSVNANVLGTYPIVYTSTADTDGNTGTNTRTVTVVDTTAPTITVTGSNNVTHEAATTYTDAGASAADSCDSVITVSTIGSIVTTTLGAQILTYTASDDSNNAATQKTRTVTVTDTTIPVITLVGEATVTVTEGDIYTDAGATAADSFQGTITASIVTTNPVDTAIPGTYTVTYNVSDASSNAATAVTRTVIVEAAAVEETNESEETEELEDVEPVINVVTNGQYVKVVVDGVVVERVKIQHKKFKPKYYKLKTARFYNNYTTVVLLTATKSKAQLTVLRLTSNNQLKKKVSQSFAIEKRSTMALKLNVERHHLIATVGTDGAKTTQAFKLTKKGRLLHIQ